MPETMKSALAWVNNIRAGRYGLEPEDTFPPGRRSDGKECPVARALAPCKGKAIVCHLNVILYSPEERYKDDEFITVPEYVGRFIEQFDAGLFPDLIERKENAESK